MSATRRLTDTEIQAALAGLPGWRVADGKLHRDYRFGGFVEAWSFMTAAALHVQQLDHHPEWFNVYADVRVDLITHDAGGISAHDVELAERMEAIASRFTPR